MKGMVSFVADALLAGTQGSCPATRHRNIPHSHKQPSNILHTCNHTSQRKCTSCTVHACSRRGVTTQSTRQNNSHRVEMHSVNCSCVYGTSCMHACMVLRVFITGLFSSAIGRINLLTQ
eukprot:m.17878 g.17878  ORF g.17878 m.17878 type:complete len:119 (-) comp7605_c0_seq2:1628-1984(-)